MEIKMYDAKFHLLIIKRNYYNKYRSGISQVSEWLWRHLNYRSIADSPQLSLNCWRPLNYRSIADVPSIIAQLLTSPQLSLNCWRPSHSTEVPVVWSQSIYNNTIHSHSLAFGYFGHNFKDLFQHSIHKYVMARKVTTHDPDRDCHVITLCLLCAYWM